MPPLRGNVSVTLRTPVAGEDGAEYHPVHHPPFSNYEIVEAPEVGDRFTVRHRDQNFAVQVVRRGLLYSQPGSMHWRDESRRGLPSVTLIVERVEEMFADEIVLACTECEEDMHADCISLMCRCVVGDHPERRVP